MYRSIATDVLQYWIRLLRASGDLRFCSISIEIHKELKRREQPR